MTDESKLEHNLAEVGAELSWAPATFVPWVRRALASAGDPTEHWADTARLATVSTTGLRRNTAQVLRAVSNERRFILTRYGRIIGLILPIAASSEQPGGRRPDQPVQAQPEHEPYVVHPILRREGHPR